MAIATISDIEAPKLRTIPAGESLYTAVEVMLNHDYSQLGVVENTELLGMVSLKSISRGLLMTEKVLGDPKTLKTRLVGFAVEQPKMVNPEDSIEDLFELLGTQPYVLVRSEDRIPNIVTEYNIRKFLWHSTFPYLMIEKTELAIRQIIEQTLADQLQERLMRFSEKQDNLREIEAVEQCTFAHYEQLISTEWDDEFSEVFDEDQDFIRELISCIGDERNQLLHFRARDWSELDIELIRFGHEYFISQSKSLQALQ